MALAARPRALPAAGIHGFGAQQALASAARLHLEADVCVVGSGAGGALVAAKLAEAGLSVVVLERGCHVPHEAMSQREFEMAARLMSRELYAPAEGRGARVPIVRGECVGGSSVIADAICHDPPAALLERWASMGLDGFAPSAALARLLAEVKADQSIGPVRPEMVNRNNAIFALARERSGYAGGLVERNLVDGACRGAGFCAQGCRYADKRSSLATHLPRAVAAGAVVLAECAVGTVVPATVGFTVTAESRPRDVALRADPEALLAVTLACKRVVLAAGAIETPRLLRRSHASFDPFHLAGIGLSLHYQTFVAAHLPGVEVRGFEGLPVSHTMSHFAGWDGADRDQEGGRFWIDAAFSHPWNLATTFSCHGAELVSLMDGYDQLAGAMVYVPARGRGRVLDDSVRFDVSDEDDRTLRVATAVAAGMFFKVGAAAVYIGSAPTPLRAPADLATIMSGPGFLARDAIIWSSHPMGGAAMGVEPSSSLVDQHGESHHARGLHVADASAFPTPVGAPPYVTVLLHARKVVTRILEREGL